MARKVYVVTGSEDGTLGIASGVQQVIEVVTAYLTDQGKEPQRISGEDPKAWERELYRTGSLLVEEKDGSASVNVEAWELGWFGGLLPGEVTVGMAAK